MLDVVSILQLEHRNLARVLDLLHHQAANARAGTAVNARLLELSVEYLAGFPDECHHPKEDMLYRKLVSRSPELATSLKDLVKEHAELATLTGHLRQAVARSRHDPQALDAGLANQLSAFVDNYRHHMRMEEEHFFPLAQQRLSRNDIAEIDFALYDRPDPVFNQVAEQRFAELIDAIARQEDLERAGADQREEAALLATFKNIATFNETFERWGQPIGLIGSAEGGYDLMRNGRKLAHIPACSERRAAWCAYFFWKALAGSVRRS